MLTFKGWLTVFGTILVFSHVTSTEVGGRRRRSDDPNPLEAVVSTLSETVDQLTAKMAAQDSRISAQESEIATLKNSLAAVQQPVAFSVTYNSADHQGLGTGQILRFDKVIYNAGHSYNPNTGLFTAPTAGTYLFYLHLMHNNADSAGVWLEADLYAENRWLLRAAACCEVLDSGSNLVTVHLQQGETVRAQVVKGTALWGGGHTSFTGLRLTTG